MRVLGVVLMHPTHRRKLQIIDRFPWFFRRPRTNSDGVIPIHAFGESIVLTIARGPARGHRADLHKTFSIVD